MLNPYSPFFFIHSSKPLVCLFPALFKQNLLSFLYLVHLVLPQTAVLRVLKCLSQDPYPSPWVTALVRQLERSLRVPSEEPLYSTVCSQRLRELSQRCVGFSETGGWARCFRSQAVQPESPSVSCLSELGTQRKRKNSFVTLDSNGEETGLQSKRIKMDICVSECVDTGEQSTNKEMSEGLEDDAEEQQSALCDALPEHIKVESQNRILSQFYHIDRMIASHLINFPLFTSSV